MNTDTSSRRTILHCDCNNFFASVELLKFPELRDKPVAVAGDPVPLQLPPGGRIHGIADLLGAHRRRSDLKQMATAPPAHHVL